MHGWMGMDGCVWLYVCVVMCCVVVLCVLLYCCCRCVFVFTLLLFVEVEDLRLCVFCRVCIVCVAVVGHCRCEVMSCCSLCVGV